MAPLVRKGRRDRQRRHDADAQRPPGLRLPVMAVSSLTTLSGQSGFQEAVKVPGGSSSSVGAGDGEWSAVGSGRRR